MQLDVALPTEGLVLRAVPTLARAAEELGFGALWAPETQHNAFLPLALAAEHTNHITIGTSVAIAFARSPMVMAQVAWDLQALSGGRLRLGIGTQVKAHIERRFGVLWDAPVARLRDYIGALRAIWACWQGNGRLDYQGQFYQLSLMTPFFNPGPIEHPTIPIAIAGVNQGLARLAGEVAEGFHAHPFHSVAYLREVVLPAIAAGAQHVGRAPESVELLGSVFVINGSDERSVALVRAQLAFYASTPSYRPVLALHGWHEVGEQLSRLAATKRWAEMPALISDEMLAAFAVEAASEQLGATIRARYNGLLDRVVLYLPFVPGQNEAFWRETIAALNTDDRR